MNSVPPLSRDLLGPLILRLWRYIGSRRRAQIVVVLCLTVVSSFAEILTIGAVLPFLMALTSPQSVFTHPVAQPFIKHLSISDNGEILFYMTAFFATAVMLAGIIRVGLLWLNNQIACRVGADLSNAIYQRTLYQPFSLHILRNTSQVVSGVMVKSNVVVSNVLVPTLTLISAAVMITAIFGALLLVDHVVALSALAGFGLIYGVIIKLTRKNLMANSERSTLELNRVVKVLQEGLGGIRDVLIDGSQKTYCDVYRNANIRMRQAQANTLFISQCPRYLIEAMGSVLIALIAYILARRAGGLGDALPILGALALGAQRLLPVIQQAYASWASIHGSRANLRDTVELLEQPLPDYADAPPAKPLVFEREVRLRQLSFRYTPETPWVLNGVDLSIAKGSRIGFFGETGSGKSTLLDIVMGLLQPTEGRLEVDGALITAANKRSWQVTIAHVPQMIFLADSSVAENIAFGLPREQIDMARVRHSAQQAKLAELIESWPHGYETTVGERGIKLSGGQRQRIGIARALYKQAKVIIFDEATSALDGQTEESVMRSIENLGNDLTIFIIAHRLSTLCICDEIVELGKHGILRRGAYADIVGKQS
jgi:ABC-type multidrug transport system fused ATPase/permease subunit